MSVEATHCLAPKTRQGFRISAYLQELACFVGQQSPFDEASDMLLKLGGIRLTDKQIERITHHYGAILEDTLYADQVESEVPSWHYALMDGSMVLTRAVDQSPGGWKEVKLGRIFAASDLLAIKKRTTIRASEYVLHLGDHAAFTDKFSARLGRKTKLIALGDGARWIWDYWDSEYPDAIQILDYYHVVEKLGCWASVYFKAIKPRQDWLQHQEELLKSNQVDDVIIGLQSIDCQGEAKSLKGHLLTYLTNNKTRMQYQTYLQKGYLIGSGPIESANREVVQSRLKRSGQRWTPDGLQQVGNLRIAYKSNRWAYLEHAIRKAA